MGTLDYFPFWGLLVSLKLDSGSVSSTISVILGLYLFLLAHLFEGLIKGDALSLRSISLSLLSSSDSDSAMCLVYFGLLSFYSIAVV